MEKSNSGPVIPVCMLLHDLINDLSVIIGNCDMASQELPANSKSASRFKVIAETARRMIREMKNHQCELTGLLRTTRIDKSKFLT